MEARWSHIGALGGFGRLWKDFGRLWGDKEKEGRQTQEERRKQNQKEIYIYKLPINRSSGRYFYLDLDVLLLFYSILFNWGFGPRRAGKMILRSGASF